MIRPLAFSLLLLELGTAATPAAEKPSLPPSIKVLPQSGPLLAARKVVKQVVVNLKASSSISEARVRAQMTTREGGVFSDELVEQDIRGLYGTGAVENVEIGSEEVPGGVRVIVTITGRGTIGDIVLSGNSNVDSKVLLKDIELKVGDPVDEIKLAAGQARVLERYKKQGYAEASVTYETGPMKEAGFTRVSYVITEGFRGFVRAINFEGAGTISPGTLRGKMTMKEKGVESGKSSRLTGEDLNADVHAIERVYHDAGYVYAKVLEVRRDPAGSDYVDLTYVITEGEHYNVGDVDIEGNTVFASEVFAEALKTASGHSYSVSDIQGDEKMIADYYGSRGYADARVETSITPGEGNQVNVVFRVTEGGKSFLRKVSITGNMMTQDHVIRRETVEAGVIPGVEANWSKARYLWKLLMETGYFAAVDIRLNATEEAGFKDVDIAVTEQATGSVNFGMKADTMRGPTFFGSLDQSNFELNYPSFRGDGINMKVDLELQRQNGKISIDLGERDFFGVPLYLALPKTSRPESVK